MNDDSTFLMLGVIFLVIAVIVTFSYFIDTRLSFSMKNIRNMLDSRLSELKNVIKEKSNQNNEDVMKIIEEYNQENQIGFFDYIRLIIKQSGLNISFYQFIGFTFFFTVFGYFLGMLLNNYWLMVFMPIGFSQLPWFFIRLKYYTQQFAYRSSSGDVVSQLNNLYKTSQNMILSIENAFPYMPLAYKNLFERFLDDLNNHVTFENAIDRMSKQVNDPNFRLFCSIFKVSEQLGVDITEELDSIDQIYIDEKEINFTLNKEMRKDKIESVILAIVAIAAVLVGFIVSPTGYMSLLHIPWANSLIATAITLIIAGLLALPFIFTVETE